MIRSVVRNIRKLSAVSLTVIGLPSVSQASEKEVLNFGIISTESSQNLRANWQPMLDDMSEKIGIEVKPFLLVIMPV